MNRKNRRDYNLRSAFITSLIVSLAITFLYLISNSSYDFLFLKPIEWRTYDIRLAFTANDAPDNNVVLIAIDEKSLQSIGKWPWPRDVHARFIDKMREAGAGVVAFDIEFPEASPNPKEDQAMAEAALKANNVVVSTHGELSSLLEPGVVTSPDLTPPAPTFSSTLFTGHINTKPDQDGVLRRNITLVSTPNGITPSLSIAALATYFGVEPPTWDGQSSTIQFAGREIPVDRNGRFLVDFAEASAFPVISYADVLNGNVDPSFFKDKIVLVGYWAMTMADLRTFPVLGPMTPGVLFHANAIQTVLYRRFITPASPSANLLVIWLLTFLPGMLFFRISPVQGSLVFILLAVIHAYINTAYFLGLKGILYNFTQPTLGLILSYFSALGVRIVIEQRDRLRITGMFQRYVDPEVVKEILATGEEALRLGGARRPVTVLFLDVRGFTPLTEKLQPEEVVDILNSNFEMITQVIFKYGGTLDKFIGDAVMAVFNSPLNLPDHQLQAVLAAREIQERAKEIRDTLEAKYGRSVQFGIGVNTGDAVCGNIGSSTRMEYTAIGDAVNLAARLEANSKPGQVLISQAVWEAVKDQVETVHVGPIMVKGKSEPVNVYSVVIPGQEMEHGTRALAPAAPKADTPADAPAPAPETPGTETPAPEADGQG